MASARNKVVKGKYEGNRIQKIPFQDKIEIIINNKPNIELDKYTVESYEVITEETLKSGTSAVLRGAFGAFLLGPVGLLAGLSAKNKGIYYIAIKFKSGDESLIEINEKLYKIFKQSMYKSKSERNIKNIKKYKKTRTMVIDYVDLDCPLEVEEVKIKTESDTDIPYLEVNFKNLSEKVINAIKFKVYCFNSFKEPVETPPKNTVDFLIQDLTLKPKEKLKKGKVFSLSDNPTTRNVYIIVEKISFKNGTHWNKKTDDLKKIIIPKIRDEKQKDLKTIAGGDAITYPFEDENSWTCVCGRYNNKDAEACIRCNRKKEKIFKNFTEKAITIRIKEKEKKDLEEYERYQKRKKEKLKIKKAKIKEKELRRKRAFILIAILGSIFVLFSFLANIYF